MKQQKRKITPKEKRGGGKTENREKGKGEGNIQHPIYPTHSWIHSGHANKSAK